MKKISNVLIAVMLLVNVAPASAATLDLTVSGNGSDSDNTVMVQSTNTTVVSQTNTTNIENNVNANASTGGNTIDGTTGGDSVIDTGKAKIDVNVQNTASSNVAEVETCGCDQDAVVTIEGNGSGSENEAGLGLSNATVVSQTNATTIDNDIDAQAETGDNKIKDTTGGASVILTGKANIDVDVDNMAGSNAALVNSGNGGGSSVDLLIKGNGSDSDNAIKLKLETATVLSQLNKTSIGNDIWTKAKTGKNEIKDATGGLTGIETGEAKVKVDVSNQAGFNAAQVDGCDCVVTDVNAKIKGNGTDSKSEIKGKLSSAKVVSQSNTCGGYSSPLSVFSKLFGSKKSAKCFDNEVGGYSATGSNKVNGSTAESDDDPYILTGVASFKTFIDNVGGSNMLGGMLVE